MRQLHNSGIPAASARFAAPAARNRRGGDCARQSSRHLSGALHAGGGDESMPLRARRRARLRLPPRAQCALHCGLPGAHLRSAARPYRPAYRGAGGDRRRPNPAAADRGQPRSRRARRVSPRTAGRALRRHRATAHPQQRGGFRRRARGRGAAGCQWAVAAARSRRCDAALGTRLSPCAPRGAHAGRSRRRRQSRPRPPCRSVVLPRAPTKSDARRKTLTLRRCRRSPLRECRSRPKIPGASRHGRETRRACGSSPW